MSPDVEAEKVSRPCRQQAGLYDWFQQQTAAQAMGITNVCISAIGLTPDLRSSNCWYVYHGLGKRSKETGTLLPSSQQLVLDQTSPASFAFPGSTEAATLVT